VAAPAANRRGVKKTTSASAVLPTQPVEHKADDQGEAKVRGKKKPTKAQEDGAAAEPQPEPSTAAAKPKRAARAAKGNKNYAEEGDEAM